MSRAERRDRKIAKREAAAAAKAEAEAAALAESLGGRRWMARSVATIAASQLAGERIEQRDRKRSAQIEVPAATFGNRLEVTGHDGTPLYVRSLGSRQDVTFVLTHGLCCDHRLWLPMAGSLAPHGRVIAWDLRGHGRTPAPGSGPITPAQHARDLAAVVDAAGPGPVVLVGHSLGGMTTLRYLVDVNDGVASPAAVAAVALIATPTADITTSGVSGTGLSRVEASAVRSLLDAIIGNQRLDARFVTGEGVSRGYALVRMSGFGRKPAAAHVDLVHKMITQTPVEQRQRAFQGMFTEDLRPYLEHLDIPALVMTGARDRVVNPVQTRRLGLALPRADHVEYASAGHAVVLERHESIARRVLEMADQALTDANQWNDDRGAASA